MALLTTAETERVKKAIMRGQSRVRKSTSATKANLDVILLDLDTYQDNNAGVINQSISLPERNIFDSAEKAIIFTLISAERYIRDEADWDLLRACIDELVIAQGE